MGVKSYRQLLAWQKAMDLAVEVYRLSGSFPLIEKYRLTSQITRAVTSVPANIAEGSARSTRKDYAAFIAIARGSLAETETYLLLAQRLGYLDPEIAAPAMQTLNEVERMLAVLRTRLLQAP